MLEGGWQRGFLSLTPPLPLVGPWQLLWERTRSLVSRFESVEHTYLPQKTALLESPRLGTLAPSGGFSSVWKSLAPYNITEIRTLPFNCPPISVLNYDFKTNVIKPKPTRHLYKQGKPTLCGLWCVMSVTWYNTAGRCVLSPYNEM